MRDRYNFPTNEALIAVATKPGGGLFSTVDDVQIKMQDTRCAM